jgi:threonylcarbamoyladenosine tRNA methylthiotransferase MtaB
MPTLRTATLGCKVNQYETQYLREGLQGIGYREAVEDEAADLCIVNTCTVTAEGDAKSRQVIRQLARRNPGTRIVVMGCYATRAPKEVAALPAVAEVLTDKRELPDLLGRFGVVDVPTGIAGLDGRQRAYVKVQDGCLLDCTFCIIPKVRPVLASRPAEQILAEIERLTTNGYHEIVLTGIHLGHYGIEFNRGKPKTDWLRLSHLLSRIARMPGEFRVRLSSIEATEVTRELIQVMADHPARICPHLHISLQSGSDRVLRRMRRRWGAQRVIDRVRLVHDALDQPAISTDIIVGFPGETDEDFAATCRVVDEIACSKIHVFPFSARRGTTAAEMQDQVPAAVKAARAEVLSALADRLRDRYFASLRGRTLQVLVEPRAGSRAGYRLGTSCRYAPVEVPIEGTTVRHFVNCVAGEAVDGCIRARLLDDGRTLS